MSTALDKTFINQLSSKLKRFSRKRDNLYTFRCPVCGDSKKNKLKARGYFYIVKNATFFGCHNCNQPMPFGKFLKEFDPPLFGQYQLEKFKENKGPIKRDPSTNPAFKTNHSKILEKIVFNIPKVIDLPEDHPGRVYLLGRELPSSKLGIFYFADDFKSFCDETFKNHEKNLMSNDPRIIIPLRGFSGELLGIQGRSINPKSELRYITMKMEENLPKVFGLDAVNKFKRVYVVEGAIDSLYIDNCVASTDANLMSVIPVVGASDYVFIYDNEPRNEHIVRQIGKCIEANHKVCLLPSSIPGKDINSIVLNGYKASRIRKLVDDHTFYGLQAKLEFNKWRKI